MQKDRPQRNLSMLTDFYELTMANGYLIGGIQDRIAVFDMFFRRVPDRGGFAVFAGLEQLVEHLQNLHFTAEDIEYLRGKKLFDERFLSYLENFEFCCDLWAFREGSPMFANEPIVVARGPVVQLQMIETMLLLTINHQSLIATKANRIVRAALGRTVMEFGSRRAQGYDAAIYGARAAYIGGCQSTACTLVEREYGVPTAGTMAHSWVQMFDSEYEAFKAYAETYPRSCTLLVDTYNALQSGVPNAIRVFNEVLAPRGFRPIGIRIDSGDLAYLSKRARGMLDAAGYTDCKIIASNALDEYIIRDLLIQNAPVDSFGVGEKLITSKSDPVMGGVYKLAAVQQDGEYIPKIKVSESLEKITTPGFKNVYRFFDPVSDKAIADYITCRDEVLVPGEPIVLFDPNAVWKKQTISNYKAEEMLQPVFEKGKLVAKLPSLQEIQRYSIQQVDRLWDEAKRLENPHRYYVDLSQKLWQLKQDLLLQMNS